MSFSIYGTELRKYKQTTAATHVRVPDGIVTISPMAFEKNSVITHVTLPDSVRRIDYSAFSQCSSLMAIDLPEGLEAIGNYAFADCVSLVKIIIPNSVTEIYPTSFRGCTSLKSVTISEKVEEMLHGIAFRDSPIMRFNCGEIRARGEKINLMRYNGLLIRNMLKTRNYEGKCVSSEYRFSAAADVFINEKQKEAADFIRENAYTVIRHFIYADDAETVYALLYSGDFVTADNIDSLLRCSKNRAQKTGYTEIFDMITKRRAELRGV